MLKKFSGIAILVVLTSINVFADDWPRFRGPQGSGVAESSAPLPTEWSAKANLAWKTEMPGPGASSPIVVGNRAFVTCYSGYGLDQQNPGDIKNLVRHLVCIDINTGKKMWQADVKAAQPEDAYTGIGVTAHGYASHTPVSDGKNVYAFFGKSGVHAFDLDGNELWQADVGMESDPTKWGSSSSPIVHDDTVIVTASAESQAVIGFDKKTGKELWRQEAEGLDGMWGTPAIVKIDDSRTDLVMCVAKEMWGLDPATGKMRWFANATEAQHAYSSVIVDGKRVFAFTGRGGGSIAIDAGGTGNVSDSNTVWTGGDTASFATPVRYKSKIYSIAQGILTVVDANNGERIERLRLKGAMKTRGRTGSLDYPSPIAVNDHLYYMNGSGQMYVFDISSEKVKQLAVNRTTTAKEIFWGSPAVSDGKLILRSQKYLYCVADKGEKVDPEMAKMALSDAPEDDSESNGRRRGRDPMAMFKQMDGDKDGKLTAKELDGNPMAKRLMTLDKDGDEAVSAEEWQSGIMSLFRRGGGGGSGGYERKDTRPDRPQRPKMADDK